MKKSKFLVLIFSVLFISCANNLKQPNVLMIIVDDMNDYAFYNTIPEIKIPNIDKLKSESITFNKAYCGAPVCVASRASVFSGLYPHNSGAYLNGSDPWKKAPFTKIENMMECFQRNGYQTYGRGKVLHSNPEKSRKEAMWNNKHWGGGFGPFADSSHALLGKFWGIQAFPDSVFPDVINADSISQFLSKKHDKPFFAVYGLWRPHTPFTCPQRFYDMYPIEKIKFPPPGWLKNDLSDVSEVGKKLAKVWGERYELCGESNIKLWKEFLSAYMATTSFADYNVGRVLTALEESNYDDNTIVIFWSDNGYHCGEKNHWEKSTLWEQAARTPFAIRNLDNMNAGKVSERTVNTVDIFPTLVELCGLEAPKTHKLDGISLAPLLVNPDAKWNYPAITEYGEGMISVRNDRFRYIQYSDGTEELYDHNNDPFEHTNIAPNPKFNKVKEELKKSIPAKFAKTFGGRLG